MSIEIHIRAKGNIGIAEFDIFTSNKRIRRYSVVDSVVFDTMREGA